MKPDTWEFYEDPKDGWRWRRKAENGRTVGASTHGFESRSKCLENAKRNGYSKNEWSIFKDKKGEWRWHCVTPKGQIIGASTEGYKNRPDCVENAMRHGYYEPRSKRPSARKRSIPARGDRLKLFSASRFLGKKIEIDLGLRIPLDVYLQDPSLKRGDPGHGFDTSFFVSWEPHLSDGPTSSRFAIVDYNSDTGTITPPARWNPGRQKFVYIGRTLDHSTAATPQFQHVNVWAILQDALRYYEEGFGLGRAIPWGFEGSRLLVVPHAGYAQNAFYDRNSKSLQFYYFDGDNHRVETCLSADIIRHEFAHAILDGIRPYFLETCLVETAAFHEFLGDLTAILLLLRNNTFRRRLATKLKGELSQADQLANIADEFGKVAYERDYLRSARNTKSMSEMEDEVRPHTFSQVLTGAMWEILISLSNGYIEREKSAKQAFWLAIERMQRMALQPLDLLPPVDVTFRDYALAALRAEELSNPKDPWHHRETMLNVFCNRGILSAEDVKELLEHRYLYSRVRFDVYPAIDVISKSRADAYWFVDSNRRTLRIPWNRDVIIADLYSAQKLGREARRLPQQLVLQYLWREEVPIDCEEFGHLNGHFATMMCGGTLVFDESGNVLWWCRKPGTEFSEGKYGQDEVERGSKRRDALLNQLKRSIRIGQVGAPSGLEVSQRPVEPLIQTKLTNGVVNFQLSPHVALEDEDPDISTGARKWQMSF